MCGISGIIFNNYKKNSYVNSYSYLLDKINDLDNIFKSQNNINLLYDLSWNYKNDKSFLNFFKKNTEKEFVNKISNKIDEFLKKISYLESEFNFKTGSKIEKIKDIKWFLKEELQQNFNFIKNFIDKDDVEINDTSIIFLKNLASIINSINFLEMRGRDSLGISINLNMKNIKEKKLKNIKNIFNYKKHQDLGKRQAYHSTTNFSWDKMKELLDSRLTELIPEFPKEIELKLPKLNLPKLEKK